MKKTNLNSEYFYLLSDAEEFVKELKQDGIKAELVKGGDGWYVEWVEGNQKRKESYYEYFYLLNDAKEFVEELKQDGIESQLVKGGDGWYVEWEEA